MEYHNVPVFHEISVFKALSHVKGAASGSDKLPFCFGKSMPGMHTVCTKDLKTANVRPIPKETNIFTFKQLRPISITDILTILFERLSPGFLILSILISLPITKIVKLRLPCYIISIFG